MTPKELLYIEDALGHEENMKICCQDFATKIQDPELRNFVQELSGKHQECFNRIYGLLN